MEKLLNLLLTFIPCKNTAATLSFYCIDVAARKKPGSNSEIYWESYFFREANHSEIYS